MTFADALEAAYSLPLEEQETLIDMLRRRLSERRSVKPSSEERLKRLAEAKVIVWDGRKLPVSVARVPLRGSKTVSEILLEDRE